MIDLASLRRRILKAISEEIGVPEEELVGHVQYAVHVIQPSTGNPIAFHSTDHPNHAIKLAAGLLVQFRDWAMKEKNISAVEAMSLGLGYVAAELQKIPPSSDE